MIMILAFIAGFIDTATFVGADQMFSAHVTGNFVVLAANLLSNDPAVYMKLLTFPVFAAGVMFVNLLEKRKPMKVQVHLLLIATLMILTGAFSLSPLFLVFAMAIQNAIQKVHFKNLSPSTVMTGNVTTLFLNFPKLTGIEVIGSFLTGCLIGALSTQKFGMISVIFPGILLLTSLVQAQFRPNNG